MYRKNTKLKGTVLFTVVSVMSILLIFLLSTLVLAASANKRSHKTYASTQTEYAARTAIESFFAAMESNDKIAEAVEELNGTIYPTVNIDSKGFGDIFCYDNSTGAVLQNKIKVEKLSNDPQYVYTEAAAGVQAGWSVYYPVRITANAQLGKEESSISAYIRKKAPYEPKDNDIKGLQTVGMSKLDSPGSVITGGAGIGIIDASPEDNTFSITNDPIFETDLTYINGGFSGKTSMSISVEEPGSGTVIMGNVDIDNDHFVDIKYDASTLASMQEVPYLYVKGKLTFSDKCNIIATNDQPYNIFCGWIEGTGQNNIQIDADVYLMMKDVTSTFGFINQNSKLKKWSTSVATQTKSSYTSNGGNIYSKGSVVLNTMSIDGDVRVEQNLQINGNSSIKGDIVVGGKLIFDDSFINSHKSNDIYCASYEYVGTNVKEPPSTGDITSELEFGGIKLKPISDYTKSNAIYPPDMEEDVINGDLPNADGEKNKIVAQLEDVRLQLDYKEYPEVDENGNPTGKKVLGFDPNIYHTDIPKEITTIDEFDLSSLSDVVEITNNTHITGDGYVEGSFDQTKTNYTFTAKKQNLRLNIKPIGEIWVKLTDISVDKLILDIDDSNGTVNFLVDGNLDVNHLFMLSEGLDVVGYKDKSEVENDNATDLDYCIINNTVTENTTIGVNWYSTKDSRFIIVNNGAVIGVAKAPYMDFYLLANSTFRDVKYTTSTKKELSYDNSVAWVGGALLNSAYSKNKFVLLDACQGGSDGNVATAVGDYKIMYFDH